MKNTNSNNNLPTSYTGFPAQFNGQEILQTVVNGVIYCKTETYE